MKNCIKGTVKLIQRTEVSVGQAFEHAGLLLARR